MAKKVILKDQNNVEILPITRGELILDSSGKEAFHSNDFLATQSQPGLMSAIDKQKLDGLNGGGTLDSYLKSAKITNNKLTLVKQDDSEVYFYDNYRPIQVGSNSILEYNNTALNLVAGNNISITAEKNSQDKYTGKVTIQANDPSWDDVQNKPTNFTPTAHQHATSDITILNNYVKATTLSNLDVVDTLNIALGKLEYKADLGVTAYDLVTATNKGETIDNLHEILEVLKDIKDTDTIQGILGNYVTLNTDQTITGVKTFQQQGNSEYTQLINGSIKNVLSTNGGWSRVVSFSNISGNTEVTAKFGVYGGGITNNGTNNIHYLYLAHEGQDHGTAVFKVRKDSASINNNEIYHKGNLTKLSDLTDDILQNKYLPLAGGTMSGMVKLSTGSSSIRTNDDYVLLAASSNTSYSGVSDGILTTVVGNKTYQLLLRGSNTSIQYYRYNKLYDVIDGYNYSNYLPFLNSTSTRATNTSIIYAPSSAGQKGQVLVSNGSGTPLWKNSNTIIAKLDSTGGSSGSTKASIWFQVAELTRTSEQYSEQINANVAFYVTDYYQRHNLGILRVEIRFDSNKSTPSRMDAVWLINKGYNKDNVKLSYKVDADNTTIVKIYIQTHDSTYSAVKLVKISDGAWYNEQSVWTLTNTRLSELPSDETYYNSVNAVINNSLANKLTFAEGVFTPGTYDGSVNTIINIPTKLSDLLNDSGYITGGPYLPLSGGTLTANKNALTIKRTDSYAPGIIFNHNDTQLGSLGVTLDYEPYIYKSDTAKVHKIWHEGNFNPNDYTTLYTNQTISGSKTFTKDIILSYNTNNNSSYALKMYENSSTYKFLYNRAGDLYFDSSSKLGKIWRSDNDGSGSGLDADLLDGIDSSEFFKYINQVISNIDFDSLRGNGLRFNTTGNGSDNSNVPDTYGFLVQFDTNRKDYGGVQMHLSAGNILKVRSHWDSKWKTWTTILGDKNYTDYINTTNFPGIDKVGTVTSIAISNGGGLSISGSPITTSGTIAITNTGVRSIKVGETILRVNTNGTETDITVPYATKSSYLKEPGKNTYVLGALPDYDHTSLNSEFGNNGTNNETYYQNYIKKLVLNNPNLSGIMAAGTLSPGSRIMALYRAYSLTNYNNTGMPQYSVGFSVDIGGACSVWGNNNGNWFFERLAYTSQIPTVTNYYWADVKISSTSSTTTTPTFGEITASALTLSTANGIKYKGSNTTNTMIKFIDNTVDSYGNGIIIGGGGVVIVGSGESATSTLADTALGITGGMEKLFLTSDGDIVFYTGLDTTAGRKNMVFDGSGHLTVQTSVKTPQVSGIGVPLVLSGDSGIHLKYANSGTYGINFQSNMFKPFDGADGTIDLGTATGKWKGVYAKTGNFDNSITVGNTTPANGVVKVNTIIQEHADPTKQCLWINSSGVPEGTSLTVTNAPGIGFHISNHSWGSIVFTGAYHFLSKGTSYYPVKASKFIKSDSSDSYILLGGGGHKALSDFMLKSEVANQELSNNLTTITKELTVTQEWMDTGIAYNNLPDNGSYIVQVYVQANDETGQMYSCYWSGVMTWFVTNPNTKTNDTETDEIILHRSGHAYNNTIYLRTIMTIGSASSSGLKLQIAANKDIGAAYTYTFKFKRII